MCSCDIGDCCNKCCDNVPIFLVAPLVLWSYYVYMFEFCVPFDGETFARKIFYITVFNILFIAMVVTWLLVMFTRHDLAPPWYRFPTSVYDRLMAASSAESVNEIVTRFCIEYNVYVYTRDKRGFIRYCLQCRQIKPDRAHHCSTCRKCTLKMDHHCPWVGNCVGYNNYKQFVLLIIYTALYSTFYACTILEAVVEYCRQLGAPDKRNMQQIFGFLTAILAGLCCWSLLIYHIGLMSDNETTLEAARPTVFVNHEDNNFNMGTKQNFYQTCGFNVCLWCIPVRTGLGDGFNFEINRNVTINSLY